MNDFITHLKQRKLVQWALAYFAIAREQMQAKLKSAPDDHDLHAALAQCLSGMGKSAVAVAEARRAVALQPIGRRVWSQPRAMVNLARVQAQAGDAAGAIATLGELLATPSGFDISVDDLRIDPAWDPLRKQPDFQALLRETP